MNYKNHLTHWRGKPLKDLSRDDALNALQDLNTAYHSLLEAHQRLRTKAGLSTYN